jgi:DHA1 family bicyclomycin/chloramphenicol resistance-like MFS transporter
MLAMFFLFLLSVGIGNPNATALALAPFAENAGSASALLGATQMGIGAIVSTSLGIIHAKGSLPVIAILFATAFIGLILNEILRRFAPARPIQITGTEM